MIPILTFRPNLSKILAAFVLLICAASLSAGKSAENSSVGPEPDKVASVQEMIEARTDVWGDAAMRQPNGASYEFFKDLLPPVRWANAEFRYYPIVLSAPRAAQKTRLVSNGSAINARGNKPPVAKPAVSKEKLPGPYWKDQGVPIRFFVGEPGEPFGGDFSRLQEPSYLDGYLPVVRIAYKAGDTAYQEEAFAPVDETSAANGAALI